MSYNEPRHSMSVVTRRTGLTSHAIRVWEKRYNAVEPQRTDTNRRLYSDADIDRLRLLHAATLNGHTLSQIAHRTIAELEDLLRDVAHLPALGRTSQAEAATNGDASNMEHMLAAARAAIETLDDSRLERVLREANTALPRPMLLDSIVSPLMEWLGQAWRKGALRVTHEHFASAIIRNFLITLRSSYAVQDSAPVIVVATPIGQHHEIGALVAAETAASEGWHVVYMGIGLPAEDIGFIARESRAAAVALSIVYPPDDPELSRDLRELDRAYLPAGVTLLVGGSGAAAYRAVLDETSAKLIADMVALRDALHNIRATRTRNVQSAASRLRKPGDKPST